MINLDTLNLQKIDPAGIYHDISNIGKNFYEGWESGSKMPIPSHYIKCKKIVFTGMGGSGLAARLAIGLTKKTSRVPLQIISDYTLPNYIDNETLLIAISYSGVTEETIETFIEGFKRNARLIAFGTGEKLENLARKYQVPFFRHQHNICKAPRLAISRHFGAILAILNKFGVSEINGRDILKTIALLENTYSSSWSKDIPTENNLAKKIAREAFDKIPIIWASDHLEEMAHGFKSFFNENSKSMSYFEPLPEMNHKSLAGCEFPKPLVKNIYHLFLASQFSHPQNQKRIKITAEFFKKRKYATEIISFFEAQTPLTEVILSLSLGCFISFYLSALYGIDPTPVEAVQEFKEKLCKEENRK